MQFVRRTVASAQARLLRPDTGEAAEQKGNRRPSIFWVSLTSVGPATRRGTSRCIVGRSANAWRPSSRPFGPSCDSICMDRPRRPGSGSCKWYGGISNITPSRATGLKAFRNDVLRIWFQTLRRRSQRRRLSWKRFRDGLGSLLPPIQILQPYPSVRFDATYPHLRGKNRVR